jgi:hypothetical protein
MKVKLLIVGAVCSTLLACAQGPDPRRPPDYRKIYGLSLKDLPTATPEQVGIIYHDAIEVPMVRVLANPEQFDGKAVRVYGVLSNEPEGTAIYLDRESYEYGISANAIAIASIYTDNELLNKMEGHYVWLVGIYEAESGNRLFKVSGHLREVAPMSPPNIKLRDRRAADEYTDR